jgi:hypothetical protein
MESIRPAASRRALTILPPARLVTDVGQGNQGSVPKRLPRQIARLLALSPLHFGLAVATWRDLDRRGAAEVRGSKRFWRLASSANPAGALGYWAFGRKRGHTGTPR